jgi:hypothetical protein
MPMADLKQLEFYVLRYVPYVVRGEFINIGALLLEPLPNGFGFADVRMTSDWRRVRCLDPQIDVEVLQGIEGYMRMQLQNSQDVGPLLFKFEDSFANLIQFSDRQVCLAADPALELERLGSVYLDGPQLEALPAATRPKSEHAVIRSQMKDAFTQAGIWDLIMKQISAARYTKQKGDSLSFDFGYVVGSEVKFFQAVPLKTNTTQAVNLAYRFPEVAGCILAETHASARLTAVVADDLDRSNPDIEFALYKLNEKGVQIVAGSDMPSIAERARQELNGW